MTSRCSAHTVLIYLYNLRAEETMAWRHWHNSLAIPPSVRARVGGARTLTTSPHGLSRFRGVISGQSTSVRCIVDFMKEIGFYRRIWSSSFTSVPFLYTALTQLPSTKLSDFIYNSLNFDRFVALIAFLCWCAVKHQTNKPSFISPCNGLLCQFYHKMIVE